MMKPYTVVCGGFPLVTLTIEAASEDAALIQADALLKEDTTMNERERKEFRELAVGQRFWTEPENPRPWVKVSATAARPVRGRMVVGFEPDEPAFLPRPTA